MLLPVAAVGCAVFLVGTPTMAAGRQGDPRNGKHETSAQKASSGPPAPLIAIVSIADQHIDVYGPDHRIARSRVSTGKSGNDTPTGVFSILQRSRYHESNLYSNAPMPFMQRLTWSGIALHEGHVPGYRASHGCIRLPGGFASSLWKMARIGTRVVVSPRGVKPVGFAHAGLPSPLPTVQPHSAEIVRVATAADELPAEKPRALSPYDAAQLRLAQAIAAKTTTEKAVKPALEQSVRKSAEANQSAAALKASAGILADAEEHLELEKLAMYTVQTEAAEAAIRTRINIATAGVEAARAAHEKLIAIEATARVEAFAAARAAREAQIAAEKAVEELSLARKAVSPISLFVSRKTGQVHVRQGFHLLYETTVSIADPDKPLGTHVYTAVEPVGASEMRWVVVSVPTNGAEPRDRRKDDRSHGSAGQSSASEALDRIALPADVKRLMGERLWPGASIIVSDFGLGETGEGTDFVILTR
ncbi:MAG: L,D-transpeptidase family protein [Hyphomicrobiaceae bacterium]